MSKKPRATLVRLAQKTRLHSHSPYSGHKVGAAIRLSSGQEIGGCNVENSSYGGTVCAERVAVQAAVAQWGAKKVKVAEVVVVTDATPPWPPCGFCRQVLAEFGSPETLIHGVNLKGQTTLTTLGEILPNAFTPSYLK